MPATKKTNHTPLIILGVVVVVFAVALVAMANTSNQLGARLTPDEAYEQCLNYCEELYDDCRAKNYPFGSECGTYFDSCLNDLCPWLHPSPSSTP